MKYWWIMCLIFLCQSCIQLINGSSYNYLTAEQQEKIVKFESQHSHFDKNKIYEVTGNQLMDLIRNNQRSMVYIFTSSCTSDYCVPLSVMENYAQKNNYQLYLVLSDYYKLDLTTNQKLANQLFSINAAGYNLKKSHEYVKAFKKNLHYFEVSGGKKYVGNILFFTNDSLTEIKRSVEQ